MRTPGLSPTRLRQLIDQGAPPILGGAMELHRTAFPAIAGTLIAAGNAVALVVATSTSGPAERTVVPISTVNVEPFGIALATAAPAGATPPFSAGCPVLDLANTIKVTAAASLGVGCDVGIASGGTTGFGPVSAASGVDVWRVGKAVSPAAGGEVFSLYVNPRMISGTTR